MTISPLGELSLKYHQCTERLHNLLCKRSKKERTNQDPVYKYFKKEWTNSTTVHNVTITVTITSPLSVGF